MIYINILLYVDAITLLNQALSSEVSSGSLECEHTLPRLPYTTVARRFGEHCFQFVAVEKYWPAARRYCHQVRPFTLYFRFSDFNKLHVK